MTTLLNILFGIIGGWLVYWFLGEIGVTNPLAGIGALIAGILVYYANIASQLNLDNR